MKRRASWSIQWGARTRAIRQALGRRIARISRSWVEFIAYAIQIEWMPDDRRKIVLDEYSEATAFEPVERINEFIYAHDPDVFSARVRLFTCARGGSKFITTVLNGTSGIELGEIFWQH